MYLKIKTPFSKDLSISVNNNLIEKMVFVDKNTSNPTNSSLQNMFFMIFKKKDLSLFDYGLLNWGILSVEQKMVYEYLKSSKVISYKMLGGLFGLHQRKIAYLMKINPFVFVIPCHRVVAKNSLGGYRYSVALKRELLDFENLHKEVLDGLIR